MIPKHIWLKSRRGRGTMSYTFYQIDTMIREV